VDDLRALKSAGDESLNAIHQEISRGAYENMIVKSLNKEGQISPDKIVSQWNKMDKGVKDALFDKSLIDEMDLLVKNINKTQLNDISKVNPSGTGRALGVFSVFTDPKDAVMALLHSGAIKHYYKTGELYRESVLNFTRDASGALFNTAENLKKIRNIQSGRVAAQEVTGGK